MAQKDCKGLKYESVLKNTDDEALKSLNFNVQWIYVQLRFYFYHCICQKQKPKMGVVFVVDGGGDAGEC